MRPARPPRRLAPWIFAAALLLPLISCDAQTPSGPAEEPVTSGPRARTDPEEICDPLGFTEESTAPAGIQDGHHAILPDGRVIAPEGELVIVGGTPSAMALRPDGRTAYVIRKRSALVVVDVLNHTVLQTVPAVQGYRGVAVSADGDTVWAASMLGTLHRFAVAEDGRVTETGTTKLRGFLVDVATRPGSDLVYALSNTNSHVYEVHPESLETLRVLRAGRNPYEMKFDAAGEHLMTSNIGSNTVSIIDLASGDTLARVPVCENPMGMTIAEETKTLFVACSNSDTVGVVDILSRTMTYEIDMTNTPGRLRGSAVNTVAYDPESRRLFVSLARRNKVTVIQMPAAEVLGSVATGNYPTALALTPDRATLLVTSTKGFGPQDRLSDFQGQLNVIGIPSTEEEFAATTARVVNNNMRPGLFFPDTCGPDDLPPALALGGTPDAPIRHVVLLVRENKTYDALLGDLEGTRGDPALAIFGENVTPNLHALARQFTNMDNFYSDAEHSLQGHQWTTHADCTDFTERIRRYQPPILGMDASAEGGGGSIFEHCYAHGVSFRNYGQIVGFGRFLFDDFEVFINHKYPFYNLSISDEDKAAEFVRELEQGILAEFTYILLPNDHTMGTRPGAPTPRWYVGDNDAGTGMIIEALTKSPFWPETAVFIIQDDPQGPGDHIHPNRSICVVVSPHVRRGYTTSVQYSNPSLFATMERLLGLPPLNRNTAEAPPMIDIFVTDTPGDEPDFTPFTGVPNPIPYEENTIASPMAAESMLIDWSRPDEAPGLGLIMWRSVRGDEPIPNYAYRIDD